MDADNLLNNNKIRLLAEQFIKFTGVGVIGTAAHYLTLMSLVQGFAMNAVLASSAGAIMGALINYYLNYHFTFGSLKNHFDAISKFFVIASIGFVLNGLLMTLLTEKYLMHYLVAQIITTGTVLIWNFSGNRLWTFRP